MVRRISPPVIEDDVGRAGLRIDGQPLEKLIGAVMRGIGVHAHRLAPRLASVVRGRAVNANVTIAIIAPGDIQPALAAVARIDSKLREAVATVESLNVEKKRSG